MAAVGAHLDITTSERSRRIVPGVLGRAMSGIVCQPVERLTEAGVIAPVDISVTGRLICAVVAEAALSPAAADDPRPARRAAAGNRAQGRGPESIR